jgi:predicted transcriptional regulator
MLRRLILVLALLLVSRAVMAAPVLGVVLPPIDLEDIDRHVRTLLGTSDTMPVVLIWEDADSAKHKQAAHAVVGRYSDNAANRSLFELVAIADLSHWDYWPARHYAREAFRKAAGEKGTHVWIDWKGALRSTAMLRKGESAFFVLDREHHVRYFAQGQLDDAQEKALDAAIAALGAKPIR